MKPNAADSKLQLQRLGLIDASIDDNKTFDNADAPDSMPWFLHLFFGSSGVLASFFLIGFLSLLLAETQLLNSAISVFIIGMILSACGFMLFKHPRSRHSTFMSGLAFAVSVAGQLYIGFALVIAELGLPLTVWLFLGAQLLLTLMMPSFIYRLMSSLMAFSSMVYLLNFYHLAEVSIGLFALFTTVTHMQRYALLKRVPQRFRCSVASIISALGYASAIVLLMVSVYFIAAEYGQWFYDSDTWRAYNYYLAQGLLTLASLYAAKLILQRYAIRLLSKVGIISMGLTMIMGVLSLYVSGLLATSLVIVIAMANSQRVLLGVGILALISYIFWYYYQLDTSLLLKSLSMLIIGIVMLLTRGVLLKRLDIQERLS